MRAPNDDGLEVFIIIYRYTSLMNIYDGGNDIESEREFSLSSGLRIESNRNHLWMANGGGDCLHSDSELNFEASLHFLLLSQEKKFFFSRKMRLPAPTTKSVSF